MFNISQEVFVIETKHIRLYGDIRFALITRIKTILFLEFCVNNKLSTKERLSLKILLNIFCVVIIQAMLLKRYIYSLKFISYCYHIQRFIISGILCLFINFVCQNLFSSIFYTINSNINFNTLVPSIHSLFGKIQFEFGVYIPDFILHNFKH